ncbi:MAG: sugar kinase [Caldimonas sp.]
MSAPADRKVVLVTRKTRLQELVSRYHTLAQARFYVEHLDADFADYERENLAYGQSLQQVKDALQRWGRFQILERQHLTNFIFAADDIVLALGQDGLVANTMKYLDGQPLVGINPEPARWDGLLLPFGPTSLDALLADVAHGRRPTRSITMAEARLSDGQTLRAVNDLFIGPRSHTSALYDIAVGQRSEHQSSSGVIVSTGLGSTAWLKSVMTGGVALAGALHRSPPAREYKPLPWDADRLIFAVREPFPTRNSQATLVYGAVTALAPLRLRSCMPDHGVIFSDGMEADFLRFTAGVEATISIASARGQLVA